MIPASPTPKRQGRGIARRRLRARLRLPWRRLLHPLTAILALQAGLSLSLVWSNTAFGDEAQYLTAGHLEWAHWLHGAALPPYLNPFSGSGSVVIYPPLGALADSIGGLAGARILSLLFMLGATALLYLAASRLVSRRATIAAAVIWALSGPVLPLAFATYDPLSILLTAVSAWLVVRAVQAESRRCRGAFMAAAAFSLALSNTTAYSGVIIDPAVIAFAFLLWLPRMRVRQAIIHTAWLAGGLVLWFAVLMTAVHAWTGLSASIIHRHGLDHQSLLLVLKDSWQYSGLIMALAVIGTIVAVGTEHKRRVALIALLAATAFLVPLAQMLEQTAYSLDKHLAYGIWFAAIAAGYGCDKLIHWIPGTKLKPVLICCVAALAYLAISSWEAAWGVEHGWANARSFITAFTPIAARSHGFISVAGQAHISEYYTPQGLEWTRWDALSLDPTVPQKDWKAYYESQLSGRNYGVVALFYTTTFSSATQPGSLLLQPSTGTHQGLLTLVENNSSGEPGLPVLTQVLEMDPRYHLAAKGPYNSTNLYGVYAIWQKKTKT